MEIDRLDELSTRASRVHLVLGDLTLELKNVLPHGTRDFYRKQDRICFRVTLLSRRREVLFGFCTLAEQLRHDRQMPIALALLISPSAASCRCSEEPWDAARQRRGVVARLEPSTVLRTSGA